MFGRSFFSKAARVKRLVESGRVEPIDEGLDDDFNPLPPILGRSTEISMQQIGVNEARPIPLYVCMKCGGSSFHVGRMAHTTVARCVSCRVETVIHDG